MISCCYKTTHCGTQLYMERSNHRVHG